jgi:hypothetical protein
MDLESRRLCGSARSYGLDELGRRYGSRAAHADRLDLAIIERASGGWAGEVVLMDLDVRNRCRAFRIALTGAAMFGRGLGRQAGWCWRMLSTPLA